MAKGFVHTVYKDGQWVNEVEGSAASTRPKKKPPRLVAPELAKTRPNTSSTNKTERSANATPTATTRRDARANAQSARREAAAPRLPARHYLRCATGGAQSLERVIAVTTAAGVVSTVAG